MKNLNPIRRLTRPLALTLALCAAGLTAQAQTTPLIGNGTISYGKYTLFKMVRSGKVEGAGAGCLPDAKAEVVIRKDGPVEAMDVFVQGMPPDTNFDFFVIQVPNAPFGMSWYQGDIETNRKGNGHGHFVGRFNEETFIVAPGSASAPLVHNNAFPDAQTNPPTGPIHTFHLGLWFNTPDDAVKAGCPGDVTPFNGEHRAGIQALSTKNFAAEQGPLLSVKP